LYIPKIYDFNDFIEHVYGKEGSIFTCVLGPNGSGKTEFNLLQMERIHDKGLGARYGSNMPIPETLKPKFEMDFIEDLETLEQTCRMLNPRPMAQGMKKYFFFLSELGKFIPKDEAWKEENRKFIQKLQTVRKFGLCLLSDAIDRVDARVLSPSFFNGRFDKPFPDNPRYATYRDFRTGRKYTFKDIPKCETWFDTYYTANFYLHPQVPEEALIPMNESHKVVDLYRQMGSWKRAGVTTQQGKRELFKVLDYHYTHCLPSVHEGTKDIIESKSVSIEES